MHAVHSSPLRMQWHGLRMKRWKAWSFVLGLYLCGIKEIHSLPNAGMIVVSVATKASARGGKVCLAASAASSARARLWLVGVCRWVTLLVAFGVCRLSLKWMPVPGSIIAPKLFKAGFPSKIDSAVPLITLSVMSLTLPPNWTVTVIFPRLVSSSPDGPSNSSPSFSSLVDQSLIRVSAKDEAITVPSQPVSMVACVGIPLRSILTFDAFVFPTKRIWQESSQRIPTASS